MESGKHHICLKRCRSAPTIACELRVLVHAVEGEARRGARGRVVGRGHERRVRVRHGGPRRAAAEVPLVERPRAGTRTRRREVTRGAGSAA